MQDYKILFQDLWKHYIQLNPQADKIHSLMQAKSETVLNDHVAFRTLNNCSVDVEAHAKFFADYGYKAIKDYKFEQKKLFAIHMEHQEDPEAPKIFISELLKEEFSDELQNQMGLIQKVYDAQAFTDGFNKGRQWQASYATYKKLYSESEYAAWFYLYGLCANHFTVNVNALTSFKEVSDINAWLEKEGFQLNTSGGAIKGSKEVLLEQSSTMAAKINLELEDGKFEVPGCYYEFAKRYALPDGNLYQGFVAASADKIFESTKE